MPERSVRFESLRAGTALSIGSVVLLPIERVVLHSHRAERGWWLLADKHLHALIVRDASGIRGIDAEGAAVPLDALEEEVPGLGATLAAL